MSSFPLLLILSGLHLMASERIRSAIRSLAAQGVLLALFPLLAAGGITPRALLLGLVTLAMKGIAIPAILFRAVARPEHSRQRESRLSTRITILLGGGLILAAFFLSGRLDLSGAERMGAAGGLGLVFLGVLMMTNRMEAVGQVIGFVVLENGIYLFGVASGAEFSPAIELGIFLDLFVAVFLMAILLRRITGTFSHMDVGKIHSLRD